MTEQEAINQDGEEVIEYFGETSKGEHAMYFIAGLFSLIPIVWIVSYVIQKIVDIIKS